MGQSIIQRGGGGTGFYETWQYNAILLDSGINYSQNFAYSGSVVNYVVQATGVYKMTLYGGAGGNSLKNGSSSGVGGQGGTTVGYKLLNAGDVLYICVGGQGTNGRKSSNAAGGYNGGGYGTWDNSDDEGSGGGGGATHIALNSNRGVLANYSSYRNEILCVAGGGGGKSWDYGGGAGGGTSGTAGNAGAPGTQTSGYAFGQGQNASGTGDSDGVAGGGGGWYGGYMCSTAKKTGGGGGSGYIGGCPEFVYNGTTYTSTTSAGGRAGNGAASIILVA